VRLAGVLKCAVHDLLRETASFAEPAPRFRAPRGTDPQSAKTLAAVEHLTRLGNRYVELERLVNEPRPRAPLEAVLTYRTTNGGSRAATRAGEDAARTLRSLLGMGDEPVHGLEERLENEAGLRIFFLYDMPPKVGGIFLWGDELGGCVGLNAMHPHTRRRWTLVHETGHFLRDREVGDVFIDGDCDSADASEVFAETLARSFLLPESGVARHFAEHCRANGAKFSAIDILELARFYDVSFQAMALRLEDLMLLRSGTYERLVQNRIGPRQIEEHTGTKAPLEPSLRRFPERYLRLAFRAYEDDLIGEGDLAAYLETDRVEARALYQRFRSLTLEDGRCIELDLGRDDLSAP
jgi:Zn-dependent peptidase ImmA (M78 family)